MKNLNNFVRNKNIIFIDKSINTTDLIRSSNGVISMPFTTPTIEALALEIPAIYYDPIELFPNNYFSDIDGLYINNYQLFDNFLGKVLKNDLTLSKWIDKVNLEIGISKKFEGISAIQAEIKKNIYP